MKELKYENFKGYFITEKGEIYSNKKGKLTKLKPFLDTKGKYLMIRLQSAQGKRKGFLMHRLVAEHFLENPNNLRDVHHKNNNPKDNNVSNLEWITHANNSKYSYETMPPTWNEVFCNLYYKDVFYCTCNNVKEAAELANSLWGASIHSLRKYYKSKDVKIII